MSTRLPIVQGVLAALVVLLPAFAVEHTKYTIAVGKTVEISSPNPAVLADECRSGRKRIDACTIFAEEHLSCSCERSGERWKMIAKAQFIPIMCFYVHNPGVLRHERLHVVDVRAMLAWYLDELTSREFPTAAECEQEAKAQSDQITFARRMNDFRRLSNDKLH